MKQALIFQGGWDGHEPQLTSRRFAGLLEEAGRLELPGRPICYQTTPNFLRTFGLSSLEELPLTEPAPGDDLPEDLIEGQIGFDDPGVSAGE